MNQQQINNALLDELLRQIVIATHQRELAEIPPDHELAQTYTFSQAHETRMEKLFARTQRQEMLQQLSRWARTGVATIAIIISILSALLLTSPQVRASVSRVIIEWYETFTKFYSQQAEPHDDDVTAPNTLLPDYIPPGFSEVQSFEAQNIKTVRYQDSSDTPITFSSFPEGASVSVNNEGVDYSSFSQDGIDYHVFSSVSDADSTVLWDNGGYRFLLVSQVPIDELVKIALSVNPLPPLNEK